MTDRLKEIEGVLKGKYWVDTESLLDDIRFLLDEVKRLQAQCAAMREAMEPFQNEIIYEDVDEFGEQVRKRIRGHEVTLAIKKALSTDAGSEMLERVKKLEKAVQDVIECCDGDQCHCCLAERIMLELEELEKTYAKEAKEN